MSEKGGNATSARIDPPLKWHVDGGKHYLASKLVAMMPRHTHYVEPFAGGLAVLLAKDPEGVSEVVNDTHTDLTRFWQVLQGGDSFEQFRRLCEATPFSEAEFDRSAVEFSEFPAGLPGDSDIVRAWRFFVLCRQSLAGRMKAFAPLSRSRVRRGMNEQASAWLTAVEGLPAVHQRLKRVVVLNRDAVEVIKGQDGPGTLFYCDAPYVKATRTAPDVYTHEMTDDQHHSLLVALSEVKGTFLLSGYRSKLYDDAARDCGWTKTEFELPNNSAGGAAKRRMIECVWTNFDPEAPG